MGWDGLGGLGLALLKMVTPPALMEHLLRALCWGRRVTLTAPWGGVG